MAARRAGQPGCSVEACRFVDVALRGFESGSEVVVTCHGETTGAFPPTSVVIGTDGTTADTSCYFGYAGERFWIDADGVVADSIIWPA